MNDFHQKLDLLKYDENGHACPMKHKKERVMKSVQ